MVCFLLFLFLLFFVCFCFAVLLLLRNVLMLYTVQNILTSCVLTLRVWFDIDHYQAFTTYPQTLRKMLLFGRFVEY